MSRGPLICPTSSTRGTVNQRHYVEMSSQGVVSSKKAVITPSCILLKDSSLVLAAELGP